MREIKFRAWDTPNKYMITHKELCLVPLTYDEVFKGKEGYPLMQYTGLKDKNGVEIYEGDIFKFEAREAYEVYINPSIGVGGRNSNQQWNIASWASDGEVIGNIYENPELLEDK